ncbi:MAG: hypothetical protein HYY48_02900 [Gammaproteobacteria bacterium]|nr:hypothetical protein [Gammaproteobacteria bacterium]
MAEVAVKSLPNRGPESGSGAGRERMPDRTIRVINGEERIYYEGYWIRHYDVPDTLAYKKDLIDALTRRVFHHAEPGINTPGERLDEVRTAYDEEDDPAKRRVLSAMLAGALLNRGSDILTRLVELEQIGVTVNPDNELLKECGRCFMGALEYGRSIRPVTGKEVLDELWGEPFKAFTMNVEQFLETRYIKIALTMKEIDAIRDKLIGIFDGLAIFAPHIPMIRELADSAKEASETMRSDLEIIDVWPRFVAARDRLEMANPEVAENADRREHTLARRGFQLIQDGGEVMIHLASLRVPMPRTTQEFLERCDSFSERFKTRSVHG